jgi:hypothetical protein
MPATFRIIVSINIVAWLRPDVSKLGSEAQAKLAAIRKVLEGQ